MAQQLAYSNLGVMLISIEHDDGVGQNMGDICTLDFGFTLNKFLITSNLQAGFLPGPEAK